MDWDSIWTILGVLDWGAIAQVAATVVLIVTLIITERRAGRDVQRADNSAARAESAARGTIDALDKIARSIDSIEISVATAAGAPRLSVEWEMAHYNGDTYILTNVGHSLAEEVTLSSDPTLRLMQETISGGPNLGHGEALTFMASRSLGTRDSTITVGWINTSSGEEREWRYPLPPRPPR